MKCEECGFEMDKQYLKDNHMGNTIPKYCKDCIDKAEEKIAELEKKAKERYIENSDCRVIVDMLDEDEKEELNEAHKKVYGEDYPSLNNN